MTKYYWLDRLLQCQRATGEASRIVTTSTSTSGKITNNFEKLLIFLDKKLRGLEEA